MAKILRLSRFWLPVFLWAVVIFSFSNNPAIQTSGFFWQDFLLKKTAHFIEYAVFFILFYRGLRNSTSLKGESAGAVALLAVLIYASSDEYHQTLIPGREGTLRDVLIDLFGGSFAWFVTWKYLPKAPKKLKNLAKNLQLI